MRQLLAIRSYGSFAKAAEALGISQPSLSAAIARLEDKLGVRLFERTASGSHLTPIGELITARVSKVIAETESIIRDAHLLAGGEAGTVRIGIGSALKPNFLSQYVRCVAERHPALGVHIEIQDRDRLLTLLGTRELDLIVCAVGEEIADDSLVVTPIMTANATAVSSPTHVLAGVRPISIAHFAEFRSAGANIADYTNASVLGVNDWHAKPSHYSSNTYEPLIELAIHGSCTLLAPYCIVKPFIDDGKLVVLDLDWRFTVQFVTIASRVTNYSPIISKLISYAAEIGSLVQNETRRSNI
jgi:DNA-binding transcriptional LysR family regulator